MSRHCAAARRRRSVAGRRRPGAVLNFCRSSRCPAMALACLSISCGRRLTTGSCSARLRTWSVEKARPGRRLRPAYHSTVPRSSRQRSCAELLVEPVKYAQADWLARHAAVSVLPWVASLGTLRRLSRQTQASLAFIGFGNPLLSGPDGSEWAGLGETGLPGSIQRRCRPALARSRPAAGSPPRPARRCR